MKFHTANHAHDIESVWNRFAKDMCDKCYKILNNHLNAKLGELNNVSR